MALATLGATAATAQAVVIVTASQNTQGSLLTQTGRLTRDLPTSTCASPTPASSIIDDTEPFQYRNHTLRSLLVEPVCFTVDINGSCTELFSVAYLGQFNPANLQAGYAADMGDSGGLPAYSFTAPAGSPISVVVHEVDENPSCGDYQVTFSTFGPWAMSAPAVSGIPAVGAILTGSDAVWAGSPSVQRRWQRCDITGAGCTDIPGATGLMYTVSTADIGGTLRFRNDATDADTTHGSQSAFVEPFIPFEIRAAQALEAGDRVHDGIFARAGDLSRCSFTASPPPIVNPGMPFLFDTFAVRSLLNEQVCLVARTRGVSCSSGLSPAIYNPVFAPASGLATNYAATSQIAFLQPGAVSAFLPAGESREVVVSQGASAVSCADYELTLGADAPFATARPAVSGTAATRNALTTDNGSWSGSPAFAQSWRRCDAAGNSCAPIAGATGASYTPANADVGSRLRARVTATQGRSVSSDSEPSAIVLDRTGPAGSIRLGSRNLTKALKSGRVPVRVGCDEACTAVLELRVTKTVAKRLKLRNKLVIARAKGNLAAGQRKTLRARLTKRARRALRTRKSVRFSMRATFTDQAVNQSRKARAASMKRPKKKR